MRLNIHIHNMFNCLIKIKMDEICVTKDKIFTIRHNKCAILIYIFTETLSTLLL